MGFLSRLAASFAASREAYSLRLADGSQPVPSPAWRQVAPFLDYTDTPALLAVNVAYLVVVAALTAVMRRRAAGFELRKAMIVYNAACVLLAGYVVVGIVRYKLAKPGTFACNGPDFSAAGRALSHASWVYYAQKFFEYGDTLFFVLRKSFRQLTFLHVYHHVSITLVTAAFLRYDVNGDNYLAALCNSIIHVLMYGHYLCAAFGVDTWWKKQLTSLQLVQFATVMAQSLLALWRGDACGLAFWLKVLMVAYQTSMLALFGAFFVDAYSRRRSKGKGKVA